MRELEAQVIAECRVYRDGGVHGIAIENMHDVPYLRARQKEINAMLATGSGQRIVRLHSAMAAAAQMETRQHLFGLGVG